MNNLVTKMAFVAATKVGFQAGAMLDPILICPLEEATTIILVRWNAKSLTWACYEGVSISDMTPKQVEKSIAKLQTEADKYHNLLLSHYAPTKKDPE